MAYKLSTAFDISQQDRASELLNTGAREGWSTSRVQTMLQREGLGYRRENIVEDYRHAQVVGASLTPESAERAESFYQRIYVPFKEEHDLTSTEMGAIMSAFKREAEIPEELADLVDEWSDWTEEQGT
jgi:hypothetical protein